MNNEEDFDLFDDSSDHSEHANIPRVLILHKAPNDLTSIRKKNLSQSLKLHNDFIYRINKNKEENNDNKIAKNKNKNNNVIKSNFFKQKENIDSKDKNKNNIKKEKLIELDNKVYKDNNSFVHKKNLIYKKVILKTNPNKINDKNTKENRRSLLLEKQKLLLNKNNNDFNKEKTREFNLSRSGISNKKLKVNTNEEIKIKSLKKTIIKNNNKKRIENKKIKPMKISAFHTRNISKTKLKNFSPINSEIDLKLNKTLHNNIFTDGDEINLNINRTKSLKKTSIFKNNSLKEPKINNLEHSSEALSSITFEFFNPKNKKKKTNNHISNNDTLGSNKTMIKSNNNKKNYMNKKPMRISLPLVDKNCNKNKKGYSILKKNDNIIISNEIKENNNSVKKNKTKNNKPINEKDKDKKKESSVNTASNPSLNKTKTIKEVVSNIIKEKNIILKSSNPNIQLNEEKKYYIKSHYVLTKSGKNELGQLKINQDSYLFLKGLNGLNDFNIFGVLDGHGPEGHFVSQFISRYIQLEFQINKSIKNLKDTKLIYEKLSSDNFQMVKDLFLSADIKLRDQEIESRSSGTTCVIVIQIGEHIICANVGDSRAVLIYDKNKDKNYKVLPLSIDNKPDIKEEKDRIIKMGGLVEKITNQYGREIGPWRVWAKNKEYPGLAMSRSLGDFNGKNLGIISEPKIIETDFSININYIVICSDGVWEFFKNEDIMKLGNKYYEENNPKGFCKEVVEFSTKCWLDEDPIVDDITILTIFF